MNAASQLVGERPAPAAPLPWSFPSFERREVGGGHVIACHLPGKPLAVVSLVLNAGAMSEPTGQQGVALLLARALSEGTTRRDAYEFAVAGERLGATWRADTDWDSFRCGFEVPADQLLAATELLAEAIRDPALAEATLVRVRDERVDELALDLSQPGARAAQAFAAAVFSNDSRYSRLDGGDLDSLERITPDDLRAFHRDRIGSAVATLVVVGDLSQTDIDAVGHAVFDGWQSSVTAPPTPNVAGTGGPRRIVLVDRPGSVQSMVYAGHDAPSRSTPDYVAMTTMSLALGGMFNSRLNLKLREEKGYTYGAFGTFDCRRDGGVFAARAAVQTAVTGAAVNELVAQLESMHDGGLTAEELDRARSYRAGIFPINFAGPGSVASGLGDIVIHGHPDDHFDRLRAEIQATTLDQVNAAAVKRLRPDETVIVVVGDADAVQGDLTGLPLEVVTDED